MGKQALRLLGLLGKFGYYLSTLLIVMISVFITIEIIYRNVTGMSIAYVTELSGYLLAGIVFLGLGYIYRQDGHVRMSLLLDAMPRKLSRLFYWVTDFIVGLYAAVQLWQLSKLTFESYTMNWRSSSTLEIPLYYPQLLMTIGAFICVVEILYTALDRKNTFLATEGGSL